MSDQVVQVAPARNVRIPLASAITGLSVKAIEKKIEAGKWIEGREVFKDPDGNVWINVERAMKWVEGKTT